MLWLNPVVSDAYDGNYKTVVDGEEYRIALPDFDGWPPDEYIVYSGEDYMTIKEWEMLLQNSFYQACFLANEQQ